MTTRLAVSALVSALAGAPALADTITFSHVGTGSGTLNGVGFGPVEVRLTGVSDTANRQSLGFGWWIDHTTSTVEIQGVGTFGFTVGTRTFVNNSGNLVGFSRAGGFGNDLFNGPSNPAFGTWDMLSPIGPIVGNGSFLQWGSGDMMTTGGVLILNTEGTSVTFTASIGVVCYPDCEEDGDLDIFDFLCFQGEFANQTKYADCEGDGDWDVFDFLCFQGQFANGCD